MAELPSASHPGLSARLREGTASAHRAAEAGGFVQRLLRGEADREGCGAFLRALASIYGALERGLTAHRDDPRLAPLFRPEVFRSDALASDLAALQVPPGPELPETAQYVAHLQRLTAAAPFLLAAHAYTRTLGDLSGGQLLKRGLQRSLGVGDEACAFFHFSAIDDLGAYKRGYRAALDALPLDEPSQAALVAEAVRAFELNAAVLGAIGRPPLP